MDNLLEFHYQFIGECHESGVVTIREAPKTQNHGVQKYNHFIHRKVYPCLIVYGEAINKEAFRRGLEQMWQEAYGNT